MSTLDQAVEGYSLAAQRKTLSEWCEHRGDDIYDVYADEGISGKDFAHRPAATKMLDDAKKRKFDIVLVWALSRYTRSVADLYNTWEVLNKSDVALVSVTEGFDTGTPTGRAMMGMLGVFAQMEREITAERVKLAMKERAEQGKRTCSDVLGYDVDGKDSLKVNAEQAELVNFIFDKFIAYQAYLPVAELLNAMGKTGRRGFCFRAESIRKIVTNPIYIGYYRYSGKRYKGDFKPIVDEKKWQHAQRVVKAISERRNIR